jgi:DUF4097 and DUF4098 domain-containing protein YvlB
MSTFDSPGPVAVTISLVMGDVRITASDRTDTVVEVRPASDSAKSLKMAEQTVVEYADGRLTVKTPKQLNSLFGRPGSVDVDIQLPAGSQLEGTTGMGDLVVDGRVGTCRFKSGMGTIRLGDTGTLDVNTGAGDISVVSVDGDADVATGTGELRLGRVSGTATVKNSSGAVHVGEIVKNARLTTSNGDVFVGRVEGGLIAKTAHGAIRVREAKRGEVVLQTAFGELEIGIPEGTAAWLDPDSASGVHNTLGAAAGPGDAEEQVKIRARTRWGDILIHRS